MKQVRTTQVFGSCFHSEVDTTEEKSVLYSFSGGYLCAIQIPRIKINVVEHC